MLQPENYPRYLGQALVLEPDPFVEMVDDDNPWVEGLFLVTSIGVLVGLAKVLGSLLLTASLPDPNAMMEAFLLSLRQFIGGAGLPPEAEAQLRFLWELWRSMTGYGVGWLRLLLLVSLPAGWLLQWLVVGLLGHGAARLLGGQGALNQTLGAMALMVAPRLLLLVQVIPFTRVSSLLLWTWGLLIAYRALQTAHELPYPRAAAAASIAFLGLALLTALMALIAGFFLGVWGGVF